MVNSLKPKIATSVKYQLPEYVRSSNPTLIEFLEHYYDFLSQEGNPLDFLQNIIEYKDIDFQQNVFNTLAIKQLLNLLPPNMKVDKRLMTKKMLDFFKSKGSEDSFKFIMNTLFDEEAEIEWQSKYVLKPSANTYSKQTKILVESSTNFDYTTGVMVEQITPTSAYGIIQSVTSLSHNGKNYVLIDLDDKSVRGEFILDGAVKALKNNINRSSFEVVDYYELITVTQSTAMLKGSFDGVNYNGMIIKQLGTDYQATINQVVSTGTDISGTYYQFSLTDHIGTANYNECIILSSSQLNNYFTKEDYHYGVVAPQVDTINIENGGSMYKTALPLMFESGTGINAAASIESVGMGKVDDILVIQGGYGYSIGDEIVVKDTVASGGPLTAEVEKIDGFGAEVELTMELDSIVLENGGTLFFVGDILYVADTGIRLSVASVLNGVITGLTILDRGSFVNCPKCFSIELKPEAAITGSGCVVSLTFRVKSARLSNGGQHYTGTSINVVGGVGTGAKVKAIIDNGGVATTSVTTAGSGYTYATCYIKSNTGTGASLTPVITSGAITEFVINKVGKNYSPDDIIVIDGDGTLAAGKVNTVSMGVVSDVLILDSGYDYSKNTTLTFTSNNLGYVQASLLPIITDGKVTSVTIVSPGSGYLLSDGNNQNNFTFTNGVYPTFSTSIAGSGKIVAANVVSGGVGYQSTSEVTPIKIVVSGLGYGAVLSPAISNGMIQKVYVLDSGFGYDLTTTLSITGGSGSGAILEPVIQNSKIIDVIIKASGSGYKQGTNIKVFSGDGFGAVLDANVNTGITSIDVLDGGKYYYANWIVSEGVTPFRVLQEDGSQILDTMSVSITISDPTGAGAIVMPVVDPISTSIIRVDILNGGSNYTNPTYTIDPDYSTNPGIEADLKLNVKRNIESVTVTNQGSGYSGCNVLVVSDTGSDAEIEPIIESNGSIGNINLLTSGSNLTKTPTVIITDPSNYGAISKIKITSDGYGYTEIPALEMPVKMSGNTVIADNAKLIAISDSIGSVSSISYKSGGYGYDELPWVIFPVPVVVKQNAKFVVGETVIIKNKQYSLDDNNFDILPEVGTVYGDSSTYQVGDKLLTETTSLAIAQVEEMGSPYDFFATVYDIDYEKQIVYLTFNTIGTDFFNVVTEDGFNVTTGSGLNFVYENSSGLAVNDVLYGLKSKQSAVVAYINRASGNSISNGTFNSSSGFLNKSGMLNDPKIRLHNNERYQDLAYVIKTGLSIDQYREFLKKTVHPAGSGMFGDVEITMMDEATNISPNLPDQLSTNILQLFISLTPQDLKDIISEIKMSGEWIGINKYFMDDVVRVPHSLSFILPNTGVLSNLLAEDGDRINIENQIDYSFGGNNIDYFKDLSISEMTKENQYTIDDSLEITINI